MAAVDTSAAGEPVFTVPLEKIDVIDPQLFRMTRRVLL